MDGKNKYIWNIKNYTYMKHLKRFSSYIIESNQSDQEVEWYLDELDRPTAKMGEEDYYLYEESDIEMFLKKCKELGITLPEDLLCVFYWMNPHNIVHISKYGFGGSKQLQMCVAYGNWRSLNVLNPIDSEVQKKLDEWKDSGVLYTSKWNEGGVKMKKEIMDRNRK